MKHNKKKILIIAGEASGDLHGSNVVRALKKIDSSLTVYGIGGRELSRAGMEIMFWSSELAVVGIVEVLYRLPHIIHAYRSLKKELCNAPPSLIILIDFPDFNLRVARIAKRCHVPVLYYISPQVWAWRKRRVKKMTQLIDAMAVIFPFEVPFYKKEGLPVYFVGHPLLDEKIPEMEQADALDYFHIERDVPVVGILPGSRKSEVHRLLPVMLDAAKLLKKKFPSIQFIINAAPDIKDEDILQWSVRKGIQVKLIRRQLYQALSACHLVLVASGTATLQAAIMKKPMVIVYKVSLITYLIGRMMIDVPFIGLANIVAGKKVVPELIQGEATGVRIAEEACAILGDNKRRETIERELSSIRKALGEGGASARVAELAYKMVMKSLCK